jgi:TPR repeat protein
MYMSGDGGPADDEQARYWCLQAAKQGNFKAQASLAFFFRSGRGGGPVDYEQARYWYLKASEQGDSVAQYLLAEMYENGEGGPVDLELADYWRGEAVAQRKGERKYPERKNKLLRSSI